MPVTLERFAQGMTYQAYKEQMTRNKERFVANEQRVSIDPADLAAFRALPRPLHVVVIAEDWCGDVIDNLPVLGRLAAESGKLDLRVFLRDQNLDLIDQYLKDGKFRSIPVFVVFDDTFDELGRFTERPNSVTERRSAFRRDLFAQHPEYGSPDTPPDQLPEEARVAITQASTQMREDTKAQDNAEVIRELRAIVDRVLA